MSSITNTKKAALHKKVDESIGRLLFKERRSLHDAIRGGVLVDAVYILLELHRKTVKRETKAIVETSEHEDTIFILRNQLAEAERELAEQRAIVKEHQEADAANHALHTKVRAQLAQARSELEATKADLEDTGSLYEETYADLHTLRGLTCPLQQELKETYDDFHTLRAQVRPLQRELKEVKEQNQQLLSSQEEYMAFHQQDTFHIIDLRAQVRDLKVERDALKQKGVEKSVLDGMLKGMLGDE